MPTRTAVGVVANPLSGRDVRRLVAHANVVRAAEKVTMILCVLRGVEAAGVHSVLCSTDVGGVSAGVLRAVRRRDVRWPEVRFLDASPPTDTAEDTRRAVEAMVEAGVGCIVCLGGDGTARVAAQVCGDVPLLALSAGTNNAFPQACEPTGAGLAAALVAIGVVTADGADERYEGDGGSHPELAVYRSKRLEVEVDGQVDTAVVDVAVTDAHDVGSRAVWNPASVRELYCCFAEPHAVGLSAVLGQLSPCRRRSPAGVMANLGSAGVGAMSVLAPLAPGLVHRVHIERVGLLAAGEWFHTSVDRGVVSLDGEREMPFAGARPRVRLLREGPLYVDVQAVLALAARNGFLWRSGVLSASESDGAGRRRPGVPAASVPVVGAGQ